MPGPSGDVYDHDQLKDENTRRTAVPDDFMFTLNREEIQSISPIVLSSTGRKDPLKFSKNLPPQDVPQEAFSLYRRDGVC